MLLLTCLAVSTAACGSPDAEVPANTAQPDSAFDGGLSDDGAGKTDSSVAADGAVASDGPVAGDIVEASDAPSAASKPKLDILWVIDHSPSMC